MFFIKKKYLSMRTLLKNCINKFNTLVGPFALSISFIHSGNEPIKSRRLFGDIDANTSVMTQLNSSRFDGLYFLHLLLNFISCKFSIRFASEQFAGQSRTGILFSLNHSFVDFFVLGGTKSR